jgi:hypothetical protein
MSARTSRVQLFLLQCIAPILCSIIVGFIFFQDHIFDRHYGAFQFVWTSVVGSVFYYLLTGGRLRDALAGLVFLFILTFVTTQSTRVVFILRDIFYFGAIAGSIYIFFRYFRRYHAPHLLYIPFMLAGIYSSLYVVTSEVHLAIIRAFIAENPHGTYVSNAETTAFFGLLIGFSLGVGIEVNERLFARRGKIAPLAADS